MILIINISFFVMDWEDFKVFFKEHWKIFLGVGLSVIVIIVVIAVTLVFTLGKDKVSVTPSYPPFNGPEDINGDPPKSGTTFAFPQIIPAPSDIVYNFGTRMFVHEAGYICTSGTTFKDGVGFTTLFFYTTDIKGNLKGPTSQINLDFLPDGYDICNGTFAPIYNVANEVYYLFVSVGPRVVSGDYNTNYYATNVLLYTLDTNPNAQNALTWVQGNINSSLTYITKWNKPGGGTVTSLKIPVADSDFKYNPATPWYGTFGDKMQVVLDDNESVVKQSLYISGSEYNAQLPGGNIYWFILSDNSTSPILHLTFVIQDAKLLLLKQQTNAGTISCPVPPKTSGTYINGFGSDFYVTSGNGKNNVLLVANSTNEDYCALNGIDQPAAPKGYVQGYIPDSVRGWVQPQFSTGAFKYRYIGAATDPNIKNNGFGYSVSWIDNTVIIGQAASPATVAPKNAQFLVYPWAEQPFTAGALNPLLGIIDPGQGVGGTPTPFIQTDLFPVSQNIERYNLFSGSTGDSSNIMVTTWYNQPGDVISVLDPLVPQAQPFSTFAVLQNIGSSFSSESTSNPPSTRLGFGQYTQTWLSRTGSTVRMAINDPYFKEGDISRGRFVVLTKNRSV